MAQPNKNPGIIKGAGEKQCHRASSILIDPHHEAVHPERTPLQISLPLLHSNRGTRPQLRIKSPRHVPALEHLKSCAGKKALTPKMLLAGPKAVPRILNKKRVAPRETVLTGTALRQKLRVASPSSMQRLAGAPAAAEPLS